MKPTTNEPLLYAASNSDADLRWFTQFDCCDPFLAFGVRGKRYALTHRLEYGRMIEEGCLDEVLLWDDVAKDAGHGNRKKKEWYLVIILIGWLFVAMKFFRQGLF